MVRVPRQAATRVAAAAVATALGATLLVLGLGGDDRDDESGTRASPPSTSPVVIVVSVDGLNPDAIARMPASRTRNLRYVRDRGTSTSNARTSVEQTTTLPNHTGMLTGRRVSGPAGHHVTFNSDRPEATLADLNGGDYVPGVFDVVHDHGLATALHTSKGKFRFLDRSWDEQHGAPDETGADDGRDKIDSFVLDRPGPLARRLLVSLASATPSNLYLWHVSLPDDSGHSHGFMSERYLRSVATTDILLGRLLAAVRADPALRRRTSVLLTADHGGLGASHRDTSALHNARVPLWVWGRGAASRTQLYAVNPGRQDPGTRVPDYSGTQPIRNFDVANTALRLLGLPPLPDGSPALATRP